MSINIRLIEHDKINQIIPFLQQLNAEISEAVLRDRVKQMLEQGYQCAGAYDGDKLIGICGIWILTKYYVGKHIEPDNVFVLPEYRSQGVGERLIQWVCEYGIQQGCEASELNCYLGNKAGQQFWERQGFKAIGYHFHKALP